MGRSSRSRSPSFPFIPVDKAVWRARQLYEAYAREPVSLSLAAHTWGFAEHSSALFQTVAALRQFGLVEKLEAQGCPSVELTDLGYALAVEQRPEDQLRLAREAVSRSNLVSEFAEKWSEGRPPDTHCVSELVLERNFSNRGAAEFLRVLDETLRSTTPAMNAPGIHFRPRRVTSDRPAKPVSDTAREPSSADGAFRMTFRPAGGVEIVARLNDQPSIDRLLRALTALRPMVA
jgi:hypothetical protein